MSQGSEYDGGGEVGMFSELVAQAGERMDPEASGGADSSAAAGDLEKSAQHPAASDVLAGLVAVDSPSHSSRLAVTKRQGAPAPQALPKVDPGDPLAASAAKPGSADGAALAKAGGVAGAVVAGAVVAGAAAAVATVPAAGATGAADGSDALAVARGSDDAAAGRFSITSTPTSPAAPPVRAAQAAIQFALKEGNLTADGVARAAGGLAAAAAGAGAEGPGAGGDRGSRVRRGGIEPAAAGRAQPGAAGRNAATMVDGMGASGSLTANATAGAAEAAGLTARADPQAAAGAAAMVSHGAGTDPSVFALTMNQASTSTLAATRSELMAELTQAAIDVPVDHSDFAEAFARQSVSLLILGSNNAEIQLNPRDMGPIRIAISLDADAATLDVAASHAETRAAIESSMPALRQMLADQGVRLVDWRLDSQPTGERPQQTAGDGGRHNARQPDTQHSHSQQAGGNAAGNASSNGFDNGRGSAHAGGQGGGWGPGAHRASALLRHESGGRSGADGSSRVDLYA